MKKSIAALLLLTAFSFNAGAAENMVRGGVSCGKWLASKDSKGDSSPSYWGWVLGFLSGINAGSKVDVVNKVDYESTMLYIDNYCRTKPLANIDSAVGALFFESGGTLMGARKP